MSCRTTCWLFNEAEAQVFAQVVQGLGIVLAGLKFQGLPVDVVAAKDGLEFFQRLGYEPLQVAHLVEGVLDEVFHRLVEKLDRLRTLCFQQLSGDEIFGGRQHAGEQRDEALPAVAIVPRAGVQDALGRFGQRSVVLARNVFLGLEIGAKLAAKPFVIAKPNEDAAALAPCCRGRPWRCRRIRNRRPTA